MIQISGAVEALLLMATEPVPAMELAEAVDVPVAEVEECLAGLAAFYDSTGRGFELRQVGAGWRYYTRDEHADVIGRWLLEGQRGTLSQAALETLAVVAYLQPISRGRVSAVRGVNVDGVIRTLATRDLIEEVGRDPETGARLFATTSYFLERMGLTSLDQLPPLAPHLPDAAALEAELIGLADAGLTDAGPAGSAERIRMNQPDGPELHEGIRLQKVLAQAGVASRRAAEDLIFRRRVEVNGEVVTEQGRRVDPVNDVIRVDGKRIPPQAAHLYVVLNKPRGVVSTMEDPHGRPALAEIVRAFTPERLFHVGRLDAETEGLLILTNDGNFSQRMMHPSFEVPKVYVAEINGVITEASLKNLRKGIELDDGPVKPDKVELLQRGTDRSLVRVTLHEGRNRIVRRMFDEIGQPVRQLSRIAIGPVRLGELKPGMLRELTREELGALLDLVQL